MTTYIDPDVAGPGAGTLADPYAAWSSVTWTLGETYQQQGGSASEALSPTVDDFTIQGSGILDGTGTNWTVKTADEGWTIKDLTLTNDTARTVRDALANSQFSGGGRVVLDVTFDGTGSLTDIGSHIAYFDGSGAEDSVRGCYFTGALNTVIRSGHDAWSTVSAGLKVSFCTFDDCVTGGNPSEGHIVDSAPGSTNLTVSDCAVTNSITADGDPSNGGAMISADLCPVSNTRVLRNVFADCGMGRTLASTASTTSSSGYEYISNVQARCGWTDNNASNDEARSLLISNNNLGSAVDFDYDVCQNTWANNLRPVAHLATVATIRIAAIGAGSDVSGVRIYNNIFADPAGGDALSSNTTGGATASWTDDYNCSQDTSGELDAGANNLLSTDPQFISSTDFRLEASSPCVGAGVYWWGTTFSTEMITNGDFASDVSNWTTILGCTFAWSSGRGEITTLGTLSIVRADVLTVVPGHKYWVSADLFIGNVAGIYISTTDGDSNTLTADGSVGFEVTASGTTMTVSAYTGSAGTGQTAEIDNVSCKEIVPQPLGQDGLRFPLRAGQPDIGAYAVRPGVDGAARKAYGLPVSYMEAGGDLAKGKAV